MVEQGLLSADQLSRAVAERYGLDHVDLDSYHVDMGAANLVAAQTARRFRAVPVGYVDTETLLLAMADPANVLAIDDVQMMTGLNCRVAVAAEVDIENLISRLNSLETAVSEAVEEDEEEDEPLRRRGHRAARVRRRRAGDQARLLDPRPGGQRGRLRRPLRARGARHARPLPRRRRPLRGRPGAEADGRRRRLPHQDHERARHRREAGPPGRPRRGQRRRAARSTSASSPSRPSAGRGRRSASSTSPQALRTLDELGMDAATRASASRTPSTSPTERSWSPARPARASRRRSTRR